MQVVCTFCCTGWSGLDFITAFIRAFDVQQLRTSIGGQNERLIA